MSKVNIAVIQSKVYNDKSKNLENAKTIISNICKNNKVDIVILPEMFTTPYKTSKFPIYAENEYGPSFKTLSQIANENNIYLVSGSIPEKNENKKIYNTSFIFNRNGRLIGKHRKAHLFDIQIEGGQYFKESDTLSSGNDVTVFDTEFGKFGVCICYDFRFPELSRIMVDKGCKAIFVPAAFNMTTGPLHWELLFRSRAVDNQVYTIGCSPSRDCESYYISYGHSIIVSPLGEVLHKLDEKEGYFIATIDLDYVDKIRCELPLLNHRRHDLYNSYK